jgi:hypothetical protein
MFKELTARRLYKLFGVKGLISRYCSLRMRALTGTAIEPSPYLLSKGFNLIAT